MEESKGWNVQHVAYLYMTTGAANKFRVKVGHLFVGSSVRIR